MARDLTSWSRLPPGPSAAATARACMPLSLAGSYPAPASPQTDNATKSVAINPHQFKVGPAAAAVKQQQQCSAADAAAEMDQEQRPPPVAAA